MSNPTKAKIGGGDKCTDEELLILMIASSGGTAPGIHAYEVFAKLDAKGHSAASFRHTFSALAVKAKELLASNPDVQLLDAAGAATPKKPVAVGGRKRKAVDEGEGGESGAASASGGGKKAAGVGGRKRKVVDEGEGGEGGENGAASASGGGKKAKAVAKGKVGAKKGGKKVVDDKEVTEEKVIEEKVIEEKVIEEKVDADEGLPPLMLSRRSGVI